MTQSASSARQGDEKGPLPGPHDKRTTGPAKGIGELSATGWSAAVANAVFDAIGIRFRELPITPARIIEAMQMKGTW